MILEYTISKINNDVIKECDKSAKSFQKLVVSVARVSCPILIPVMWFLSRFYRKELKNNKIKYDFYLLKQ